MITGQTAYLAMVVIGMLSLPLARLWAVIYTSLQGRGAREGALAHGPSPKVRRPWSTTHRVLTDVSGQEPFPSWSRSLGRRWPALIAGPKFL